MTVRRSALALAAAVAVLVALPGVATAAGSTLLPYASSWQVLDNGTDQTPTALPATTHFASPSYDASAWRTETVQANKVLGYGDNSRSNFPTQTPNLSYGPSSSSKYITTYFRTSFTVADLGSITSLTLNVRRDDGIVVYLNGVEVGRSNMGAGPITYQSWAPTIVDAAAEYTPVTLTIPTTPLVEGQNLLAIELHQRDGSSSDITFAAELTAVVLDPVVPEVGVPVLLGVLGLATGGAVIAVRQRRLATR